MQTDERELTERGKRWAAAIADQFRGEPVTEKIEVPDSLLYAKWF
jgi:hypothetical protein